MSVEGQVSSSEYFYIVFSDEELVLEVLVHRSVFSVNEVESVAKIVCADSHEGANDLFFIFTAASFFHFTAQAVDNFCVGFVGAVEIFNYCFAVNT